MILFLYIIIKETLLYNGGINMNKIITISRQFSSGGREVGKRLAETLNFAYYDKELVQKVASSTGFDIEHVEKQSEQFSYQFFPYQIGQSFNLYDHPYNQFNVDLKVLQNKLLIDIAQKENAVIIGRCADHVLKQFNPFKIFVYSSDMDFRTSRCRLKDSNTKQSDAELIDEIHSIDQKRASYYNYITELKWGEMANYNLCIDTSSVGVKGAVDIIVNALNHL